MRETNADDDIVGDEQTSSTVRTSFSHLRGSLRLSGFGRGQALSSSLVGGLRFGRSSDNDADSEGSAKLAAAEASAAWREARARAHKESAAAEAIHMSAKAASAAWKEARSVPAGEDSGERAAVRKKGKARRWFAAVAALTMILLFVGVVFLLGGFTGSSGKGRINEPPPPPPDLSSSCSLDSASFSYERCKVVCGEAECCFLPRWYPWHCYKEEEGSDNSAQDACATYGKLCTEVLGNGQQEEAAAAAEEEEQGSRRQQGRLRWVNPSP